MQDLNFLTLYFDDGGDDDKGGKGGKGGDDNKGGKPGAGTEPAGGSDDERTKPKYSDEDLDKIIEKKLAKWKTQQRKAVDEAARLANMSAQERAEHERDELQKELDELKRANTLAEMERTARGMLQKEGITIPDALVSVLVAEDADTTNANVKAFIKSFKAAVQDEVKKTLLHKAPSTGIGGGSLTKEDIRKEKDPIKRQKLISENMGLYKH